MNIIDSRRLAGASDSALNYLRKTPVAQWEEKRPFFLHNIFFALLQHWRWMYERVYVYIFLFCIKKGREIQVAATKRRLCVAARAGKWRISRITHQTVPLRYGGTVASTCNTDERIYSCELHLELDLGEIFSEINWRQAAGSFVDGSSHINRYNYFLEELKGPDTPCRPGLMLWNLTKHSLCAQFEANWFYRSLVMAWKMRQTEDPF